MNGRKHMMSPRRVNNLNYSYHLSCEIIEISWIKLQNPPTNSTFLISISPYSLDPENPQPRNSQNALISKRITTHFFKTQHLETAWKCYISQQKPTEKPQWVCHFRSRERQSNIVKNRETTDNFKIFPQSSIFPSKEENPIPNLDSKSQNSKNFFLTTNQEQWRTLFEFLKIRTNLLGYNKTQNNQSLQISKSWE